jgi:hypothetical protein
MRHFFFCLSLAAIGIFALGFSLSKKSDCFSPDFIGIAPEHIPKEVYPVPHEVPTILNQPFYFLGSGNQSFAFESSDGLWVLKFVKFHCLTTHDPYRLIPRIGFLAKLREERDLERQRKIERVFHGFHVAYTYDRENCGLACYHLPGPEAIPHETVIYDKAGRQHVLDLNQFVFALQQKGVPTGELLKEVLGRGDVAHAKELISSLFAMFEEEFRRGLYDGDHNVIHNTGFAGQKPMRIDFGKLTLKEVDVQQELKKIADERINPFVQKYQFIHKEENSP